MIRTKMTAYGLTMEAAGRSMFRHEEQKMAVPKSMVGENLNRLFKIRVKQVLILILYETILPNPDFVGLKS